MLEAAQRLFAEAGYEAVSMDLVAKTAGVSKATLYAHFESKENLFAEILEAENGRAEDRDWIPERFEGDAEGVLRRFARGMARFFVDGRGLAVYRLFVADLHRFPELVARFHAAGPMAMRARVARAAGADGRARGAGDRRPGNRGRPSPGARSGTPAVRSLDRPASAFRRGDRTGTSRARCGSSCAATRREIRGGER